jgi:hypothetical protein
MVFVGKWTTIGCRSIRNIAINSPPAAYVCCITDSGSAQASVTERQIALPPERLRGARLA